MSTAGSKSKSGGADAGALRANWQGKKVGRFRLLALLGQGAMGYVFRAEDTSLKRQVALKVLPRKVAEGQRTYRVEQFLREARSAATLEHPNAVHINEIGEDGGWYYISMELMEGGNLQDLVSAGGPLEVQQACQVLAESADALAAAHRMGVIHRDVKPANLMLARNGRCKVADFGLASIEDPDDAFALPTKAVGTPLYIAPEVAMGQPATAASDIYSLGATLFFLLTGRPPFSGKTDQEIVRQHRKAPIPDLRPLRPDVPESLVKALERAMAKNPEERFRDADQFAKVLRTHTIAPAGLASGSGPGVMPSNAGLAAIPAGERPKAHIAAWIGAGAGLVALALVVVVLLTQRGGPPPVAAPGLAVAPTPTVPRSPATVPPASVTPTPAAERISGAGFEIPSAAGIRPAMVAASPPAATVPPPTVAPAAAQAVPAGVVAATDAAVLTALGSKKSRATVQGEVALVERSPTGKIVRVYFKGVPRRDAFYVGYFEKSFAAMDAKFGKDAAGLVGKVVQFTGPIEIYKGTPSMIVSGPADVAVQP